MECRWCRRRHHHRHHHRHRRRCRHRRCSRQWLHYVPAVQWCARPVRTGFTCTLRTFRPLVRSISSAVATQVVPPPGKSFRLWCSSFPSDSTPFPQPLATAVPPRRRLHSRFGCTRLDSEPRVERQSAKVFRR